jgi:chromosome segregation ATPase
MRKYVEGLILVAAAASAVVPHAVLAQTQRSGGEAQKFMQQYQQISGEKAALQAQVEKLKKDLDAANAGLAAMTKERDALKARSGGSAAALAQLTASKNTAETSLDTYKQRVNELVGHYRETAGNLKEAEADRTKLRQDLAERDKAIDTCVAHNMELVDMNREILDRYEHVGLFTKASASEPFTRITRTRLENIADEYRQRAEELKVKKSAH